MGQVIADVSGGVTLVTVLGMALVALLYRRTVIHERLVRSIATKDRVNAGPVLRAYVPAEAIGLAPEQQFLMARDQIRRRAERWRQSAIVLVAVSVISSAVALAGYRFG